MCECSPVLIKRLLPSVARYESEVVCRVVALIPNIQFIICRGGKGLIKKAEPVHTLGIKLAKQLSRDWLVDVKLEAYQQRGSWRLFSEGSPGLEPLRARSIQIGATRQW